MIPRKISAVPFSLCFHFSLYLYTLYEFHQISICLFPTDYHLAQVGQSSRQVMRWGKSTKKNREADSLRGIIYVMGHFQHHFQHSITKTLAGMERNILGWFYKLGRGVLSQRPPFLAMAGSKRACLCSFGLSKRLGLRPPFLAMAESKRAWLCSFGL